MSIISSTHQYTPLTKTSTAFAGQRLVRIIAKATREGKYPSPHLTESLCVSVPRISDEDIVTVIDRMIPHIVRMCEDAQDKIVREYRIESGRNEITQTQIDMDAILGYMDDSLAGDRVSREYLSEWFSSSYRDIASQWISDISQGKLSDDVRDKKISVLSDMFAGFSSHKYSPNIPTLRAIGRFVSYCVDMDATDSRMVSIGEKSAAMLVKKEAEMSTDALGF